MLVKIPETSLVRDTSSMALINTDKSAKEEYYNKVRMVQLQKQEINKLSSEVENIKSELNEIKSLLVQLIQK